ncbi:hypothetical protein DPMN_013495 [Dreissena polymorpha]|uniref:P/Homo B domain-containing protein n=2 Tax=Dreissena polymorpha TaxID=45954 RepID=A0A9D4S2J3_DREPO|nr:hypothetical protein DPMN_013495 [Dreissena polymorpha]
MSTYDYGETTDKYAKPIHYTDRILVEFDGSADDVVKFGNANNLLYIGHVVRNFYEFRLKGAKSRSTKPVQIDVDRLELTDKKLKSFVQMEAHFRQPKSTSSVQRVSDGKTENSHPRTKRAVVPIVPTDAKWSEQWHLKSTQTPDIGVQGAWDKGFTGSGIKIAIVDDGIDTRHTDLPYNAALSYDFINDVADASHRYPEDGHGTNCAGVAAALKNSECVVGTAYGATIAGYRLLDEKIGATAAVEARALIYKLSDIDIYSNSWGPDDTGTKFEALPAVVNAAFEEGVAKGRGGKGAIYTWASGNGGEDFDDCQGDGYSISTYTIAIAAIGKSGTPTWYSEHCSAALAGTYSGNYPKDPNITTTGPSNECVNDFTGTSSACPLASGIIALTLHANSNLNWRDVQHLIVENAKDAGLNASFYTNGAGKKVSPYFGFGLMNAEAMVTAAPNWQTVPSRVKCYAFSTTQKSNTVGNTATDTIDMSKCKISFTEHVEIKVYFQSTRRGDTQLHLESPAGTDVTVLNNRNNDANNAAFEWTFMTVHLWRESAVGTWKIELKDTVGGNTLNLYRWELFIFGTITDPKLGSPSAGSPGGACSSTVSCSGTNAGCLKEALVCVTCTNGYRVVNDYCVEDGTEGGYCDDSVLCRSVTGNLKCNVTVCIKEEQQGKSDSFPPGAIAGIVIGGVALIATSVGAFFIVKTRRINKPSAQNGAASIGSAPAPQSVVHAISYDKTNQGYANSGFF